MVGKRRQFSAKKDISAHKLHFLTRLQLWEGHGWRHVCVFWNLMRKVTTDFPFDRHNSQQPTRNTWATQQFLPCEKTFFCVWTGTIISFGWGVSLAVYFGCNGPFPVHWVVAAAVESAVVIVGLGVFLQLLGQVGAGRAAGDSGQLTVLQTF